MAKQQFLLSSAIGFGLSMGLLYSTAPLAEITFDDYELAQGDGDPQETALEEVSANNMNETAIEENIVSDSDDSEENVATITAEGDFLVPTYLLPVEEEPQGVLTTSENEEIQPQSTNDVSVTKTVKTTTTTAKAITITSMYWFIFVRNHKTNQYETRDHKRTHRSYRRPSRICPIGRSADSYAAALQHLLNGSI